MFKKFTSEEVTGQNQVKASVQRKIRQNIAEEYPDLEPLLEDLLPKKAPLIVAKCQNHINLVVVNNVPLFFNVRDGPYMPTLRLLHQYPGIMKMFRVDRGAIKFVLAGANIMCPGLTSAGGALDNDVPAEAPVAIMAEGKQHALAIGYTKMSAQAIKSINKGIGVDNMHYLNDGLWKVTGEYKVSAAKMQSPLFEVWKLQGKFGSFQISHMARECNTTADAPANQGIDEALSKQFNRF